MEKKVAIMSEEARRALTPILEGYGIAVTDCPSALVMVSMTYTEPMEYLYVGMAPTIPLIDLSNNQAAHLIAGVVIGFYANNKLRKPVKELSK